MLLCVLHVWTVSGLGRPGGLCPQQMHRHRPRVGGCGDVCLTAVRLRQSTAVVLPQWWLRPYSYMEAVMTTSTAVR